MRWGQRKQRESSRRPRNAKKRSKKKITKGALIAAGGVAVVAGGVMVAKHYKSKKVKDIVTKDNIAKANAALEFSKIMTADVASLKTQRDSYSQKMFDDYQQKGYSYEDAMERQRITYKTMNDMLKPTSRR